MTSSSQWIRRIGLFVTGGATAIDLSSYRIVFKIHNADVESPNHAEIRIYNLGATLDQLRSGEFTGVVLNAGYQNGNYGVVFQGQIKQLRIGRESATDTYVDLLCADGDLAYNQGFLNQSFPSGTTPNQIALAAVNAMTQAQPGVTADFGSLKTDLAHVPAIRGQVQFGMARATLRNVASTLDASWSIQNGAVVITDLTGYRDGEAVQLNVATGLIGMPEQTDQGIRMVCLLNSRLRIGNLVQLNNADVNQTQNATPGQAYVPYNHRSVGNLASLAATDGYYRAFVVEHEGDTRGNLWHSNIIGLAVDKSANICLAKQ